MNEQEEVIKFAKEIFPPEYHEFMTDDVILGVYEQIKAKAPNASLEDLKQLLVQMVPKLLEKIKSGEGEVPQDAPNKAAALKNMLGGM